jgi:hypothetical protein
LAKTYGNLGQAEEGLRLLIELWATGNKRGEDYYKAEIYRLKGELLLARKSKGPQAKGKREMFEEIEACFC